MNITVPDGGQGRDPGLIVTPVTVLTGHTSPETAYINDHPSGKGRSQRRNWIETCQRKGQYLGMQRYVTQTERRDRPGVWNKPHGGTYLIVAAIYLNSQEHVTPWGLNRYAGPEDITEAELMGIPSQLGEYERARWDHVCVESRALNPNVWAEFEQKIGELIEYIRTTGRDPDIINGTWTTPAAKPRYLMSREAAYVTEARRRLTEGLNA